MNKTWKLFTAGLMLMATLGCGSSTSTTTPPGNGNGSIGTGTNVTLTLAPSTTQTIDAGQTVALTATITGDTGSKGVTWTVSAGGGTLSSTTGLTNTYTAPASAVPSATITATSVLDTSKTASTTVVVNPLPSFTSTGQLPAALAGVAYTTTLTATGGTGTRTFALASGTLPAGLTLNAATGVLSGTPTAAGSSTFSIGVTDAAPTPVTTTASFTLGVSALQINAPTLSGTVVGRAYPTSTYTTSLGQGAVTYAVTSGSLPAGLTLSSAGVLSGTATAAGDSTFTVTATDSVGQKATSNGSIHVASALQFTGATLPSTQVGTAFAGYTLAATGGTAPYTYTLAAGSALPAGITLSSAGVLSGTPTAGGNYSFSIIAADSNGATTATSQSVTAVFTLQVTVPQLAITTTSLPNAVLNSPYSQTIAATGGTAPYTFSVVSGALPAGIQLSTTGQLSGRATAAGDATFTVQVKDSQTSQQTVSRVFTLSVANVLSTGVNNGALKGSYAFVFQGISNGALATGAAATGNVFGSDIVGSLTFDGVSLVSGTVDTNNSRNGAQAAIAVTGSYGVNADNRGQVVLSYGTNTLTFDVAVYALNNGVASKFRFIEADADNAVDTNQVQGTGEAVLQTPSAFTTASLTGGYVFRLSGETPNATVTAAANTGGATSNPQFGALAAAGYVQLNGAGLIARGTMDASSYNRAYPLISLTGSYTAPDSRGRGTMTITPVGTGFPVQPTHYVYYVIGAKQMVLMSSDSHQTSSLVAGMAYQQQSSLFTASSLTGTVIASESGVQGGNGLSTFPATLSATFYVLRVTGVGTMSGYSVDNTAGRTTSFQNAPDPVTYTVADNGRVTLVDTAAPSLALPVFWLYDTNQAVGTELQNAVGPVGNLQLEGQTAMTFDGTSIAGTYASGVAPVVAPIAFANGVLAAGVTTTQLTQDVSADGTITTGDTRQLTKVVETGTGRFQLTGTGIFYNGYILSPTKLVYFNAVSGFTRPVIRIAEK